jgi:hypothetical protein
MFDYSAKGDYLTKGRSAIMKLFIFEYYGSYVGGTIVAIATDFDSLATVMQNRHEQFSRRDGYTLRITPEEVGWWNILREIEGLPEKTSRGDTITFMLAAIGRHAPPDKRPEWEATLRDAIESYVPFESREECFGAGVAILQLVADLPDGLYLTHTFDVQDDGPPRVVSHTYHIG